MIKMIEIWKDIKDYPNYKVSNLGNVKNKKYKEVIDKAILIIKGIAYGGNEDYYIEKLKSILDILKEVE